MARRYVEEHARKRNKSWRQVDALVAKYLLPRWAKLDIGSIRRVDVKTAIAAIARPVLANQVLAAASPIFSWAMRQEIIAANPCSGVEKNGTASRERVLSDSEIAALWSMTGGGPCRALLILERRGPVPRTPSRIVSGCPSLSTSCCRTCSRAQRGLQCAYG